MHSGTLPLLRRYLVYNSCALIQTSRTYLKRKTNVKKTAPAYIENLMQYLSWLFLSRLRSLHIYFSSTLGVSCFRFYAEANAPSHR